MIRQIFLLFFSLLLPLFMTAQVKTREAEPPKKEEPANKTQKPKPQPQKPKETAPFAYLLVSTDLDIEMMVNFKETYRILASIGGKEIPVYRETNIIKVTPLDSGKDGFNQTIEIKKGETTILEIDIGKKRRQLTEQAAQEQERIAAQKRAEEERIRKEKDPFNSIERDMVMVQGGTFQMGSYNGENDEKPVHSVTLSGYYIAKYEVTQAQWRAVMGNSPSYFSGCEQCPVEQVCWYDVQEFIRLLNQKTGKYYRLPTEAEWEYAARGGVQSRGYTYSGSNYPDEVAWYDGNASQKTHPVGQAKPNELGLFDMSGNVWEWCLDWYGTYPSGAQTNPSGPYAGSYKVIRGGSWYSDPARLRCTYHNNKSPGVRSGDIGFRLAMSAK